jgi:hypothetical protein
MNNSKELDQLVESFLQPKKSTILGLKELFALFEEVQKVNEVQTPAIYPSAQAKGYEKEHESVSFFYKIYNDTLATEIPEGNDPIDKIENFITFVDNLKKKDNQQSANLSNSLAAIIFTSSLHKLIEDFIPDQPQSAGFFFEKFINLLFEAGAVSTDNKINRFPIQDLEVKMKDKLYYLSLKLVKEKGITGSIGNMLKFFDNKHDKPYRAGNYQFSLINLDQNENPIALSASNADVKNIIYIVANKTTRKNKETGQDDNVISFNMFEFNFEQFLKMLGKEKSLAYNNYLKDPNNALKDEIFNLEKEVETFESEISRITTEIEELDMNMTRFEDSDSDEDIAVVNNNREEIDKLYNNINKYEKAVKQKQEQIILLQKELSKGGSSSRYLQFDIGTNTLETNSVKKKTNLILSLRANERDNILTENKKLFDETIDQIIEEANTISYKVNNYLLSIDNKKVSDQEREQLARKAYTSATTLQTNLGSKTGITPVDNKPK